MSDLPESTDWSSLEGYFEEQDQRRGELSDTPSLDRDQDPDSQHPLIKRFGSPSGVVMEFREGRLQKKYALEAIRAWHQGQLDVAETQIKEAVRVHKARAKTQAERYLAEIDQDYLRFLGELGLENIEEREQMIIKLIQQTSQNLKQLMELDAPDQLKEDGIERIRDMHSDFADKLQRELGELS